MNKRTLFGIVSVVLIEILMIYGFVHYWPEDGNSDLMVLDIIVSSIVLFALSFDLFKQWIDLSSPQPRQVGSLGIRWTTSIVYVILAVAVMFYSGTGSPNIITGASWPFFAVLCIHALLLLLFIGGLVWSFIAGDKVEEIANIEEDKVRGRASMKRALQNLCDEVMLDKNLPVSLGESLSELAENIRYITPSNQLEAKELEEEFCQTADEIRMALRHYDMNEEKIQRDLSRLKILYLHRKEVMD